MNPAAPCVAAGGPDGGGWLGSGGGAVGTGGVGDGTEPGKSMLPTLLRGCHFGLVFGSFIALVVSLMNFCQILLGMPDPQTTAPLLSLIDCSCFSLPTQTAAAIFFVYPTIQACAFSSWLWLYSQVPVLPAVSQPIPGTFADEIWLNAKSRSLMACWFITFAPSLGSCSP